MKSYLKIFSLIILGALVVTIALKTLVVIQVTVPSSSMENTLLPGDVLLVSKWQFGPRINLDFSQNETVSKRLLRLPGFGKIQRNDVLIFNSPNQLKTVLVKRCVALPGDKIEINEAVLYVNSRAVKLRNTIYDYKLVSRDSLQVIKSLISLSIHPNNWSYNSKRKNFVLTISEQQADKLRVLPSTDTIYRMEKERGNTSNLFPVSRRDTWSRDYYGVLKVPFKGETIKLNSDNFTLYKSLIENEGNLILQKGDLFFINNIQTSKYRIKRNYYFMMGDNRHHSIDSRWMGFVPEDLIIGKAMIILWSKDTFNKVRFERLWNFIH